MGITITIKWNENKDKMGIKDTHKIKDQNKIWNKNRGKTKMKLTKNKIKMK